MKLHRSALVLLMFLLGIAAASGYVLNGPKWGVAEIPYYINPSNSDMPEASALSAIQAAGLAWTAQSNANVMLHYIGRTSGSTISKNGKNEVFFRGGSSGGLVGETYWWYDGSYRLIEFDLALYDGGVAFFPTEAACSGGLYLQDIATHEFGHALGLGHSSVGTATMYPSATWCSTDLRTLDSDDLAGIEKLYPAGGATNSAPSVTILAPASNSTVVEGTPITFSGSAADPEDGIVTASLVWTSSIDGQIGGGGSFSRSLSAGSHAVTATATDGRGLAGSRQVTVTVAASTSSPTPAAPSGLALSARGYKVKGLQRVDLRWSGATMSTVDVLRDGTRILSVANSGAATDFVNLKGHASYVYQICEAGTTVCSNSAGVSF